MAQFEKYFKNPATGEIVLVKSNDRFLFEQKALKLKEKWEREAERERVRYQKELKAATAKQQTELLEEQRKSLREILVHTLHIDDRIIWEDLKNRKKFRKFKPSRGEPTQSEYFETVPSASILEWIVPYLRSRRLRLHQEAYQRYQDDVREFNALVDQEEAAYQRQKTEFESEQAEHNRMVDDLRRRFELIEPEAIERYVELVLDRSEYPDLINLSLESFYLPDRRSILVEMNLPHPDVIPNVAEYRYVATRDTITEKELKKGEHKKLYEDAISQIAVRTIHEIFESVYVDAVDLVIFNGWVSGIDPKTGQDFRNCILSVQAEKDYFLSLNLERVDARECVRGLKGLVASDLIELAPVKPILHLDRSDARIIEAEEVIDGLDSGMNLAEMEWQMFETLVRDLFGKMFSGDGVSVEVTRASRDAGVDAIVYDPDPIKGGKFVIQAKRYNIPVPVSAVRDLYGTVMNEGAVKGILVTTANYGKDSLEFAKDKPLGLINGSELIYLLNKHGYKAHIELRKTRPTA